MSRQSKLINILPACRHSIWKGSLCRSAGGRQEWGSMCPWCSPVGIYDCINQMPPKGFFFAIYKWNVRNCSSHMNVDSSHLDHVTKLVHLVHALAAQEPEESFFFTSSTCLIRGWVRLTVSIWHIRRLSCKLCCGTHVGMVGPFDLDSGAAMAPARRERRTMALILIWTWKMNVPCAVFQGFYIFVIFDWGQSEQ